MVKVKGNGKAKILTELELANIFNELVSRPKYSCLFAICIFCGCRISEALKLESWDISEESITFRKANTKGKLKTRTVAINSQLRPYLKIYQIKIPGPLFNGRPGVNKFLSRNTADRVLREACKRAGVEGASTHSFRRTALTMMSRENIPLRTIQEISGHTDLGTLQRYLEVSPQEVEKAIAVIRF